MEKQLRLIVYNDVNNLWPKPDTFEMPFCFLSPQGIQSKNREASHLGSF